MGIWTNGFMFLNCDFDKVKYFIQTEQKNYCWKRTFSHKRSTLYEALKCYISKVNRKKLLFMEIGSKLWTKRKKQQTKCIYQHQGQLVFCFHPCPSALCSCDTKQDDNQRRRRWTANVRWLVGKCIVTQNGQ